MERGREKPDDLDYIMDSLYFKSNGKSCLEPKELYFCQQFRGQYKRYIYQIEGESKLRGKASVG